MSQRPHLRAFLVSQRGHWRRYRDLVHAGRRSRAARTLWLLALLGGIVGSVLAAGQSAMQRFANRFELDNGAKLPEPKTVEDGDEAAEADREARKDRYSARMTPSFYFRLVLGARGRRDRLRGAGGRCAVQHPEQHGG
jgi:hypothetical protein